MSFHSNIKGGTEGDDCPVACNSSTEVMQQYYQIAAADANCKQWPGNSGENSMRNGVCDTSDESFTYDQWTNCDCSGTIGSSKHVYVNRCVVDNPVTLCTKIINYTACESDTTETSDTTESSNTTESSDTTESSNTTESSDTTESSNTTESSDTTESSNTTESSDTTESSGTTSTTSSETTSTTEEATTTTTTTPSSSTIVTVITVGIFNETGLTDLSNSIANELSNEMFNSTGYSNVTNTSYVNVNVTSSTTRWRRWRRVLSTDNTTTENETTTTEIATTTTTESSAETNTTTTESSDTTSTTTETDTTTTTTTTSLGHYQYIVSISTTYDMTDALLVSTFESINSTVFANSIDTSLASLNLIDYVLNGTTSVYSMVVTAVDGVSYDKWLELQNLDDTTSSDDDDTIFGIKQIYVIAAAGFVLLVLSLVLCYMLFYCGCCKGSERKTEHQKKAYATYVLSFFLSLSLAYIHTHTHNQLQTCAHTIENG